MKSQKRGGLFPKPLANGGAAPLANILNKRGFSHQSIMQHWADAVGDAGLAQHTFPVKLSNGVLVVKVHPAYNAIFAHQSGAVLQRLNQLLGVRVAHKIVITH